MPSPIMYARYKENSYLSNELIDKYFAPTDRVEDCKKIVLRQQSLFSLLNLQSLWGVPSFTRSISSIMATAALEKDLEAYSIQKPSPKLTNLILSVKQAQQYAYYEHAYYNCPKDIKKNIHAFYSYDLQQKTKTLENGETLLVPIGYENHAVSLELTCKTVEGKRIYNAKVFNSGDGLENHGGFWLSLIPFVRVPTLMIENIAKEAIENSDLFQNLVNIQLGLSGQELYSVLFGYFLNSGGGKIIAAKNPLNFHHQQGIFSRACATKCFNYWLKETLGKKEYLEFKVFRTKIAVKRLESFKPAEEKAFGKRWFVKVNFFTRILYFLFNFISIDAQIALAEKTLRKRERKLQIMK